MILLQVSGCWAINLIYCKKPFEPAVDWAYLESKTDLKTVRSNAITQCPYWRGDSMA